MLIEQSHNYRKINENLTSSGVVGEEILKSLASSEYQVVIDLLPPNHEHAVAREREIVESQGIEYVNIPVEFGAPMESELEEFIEVMAGVGDKKAHVHCAANWRVSAFYSVFAVSRGIWSKAQASEFIASLWNPVEYPVWDELLCKYGLGENDI